MQIEAFLFDKDGTLFDFGATWEVFAEAFLLRVCGQDATRAQALGLEIGFDFAARRFFPNSIVIAGTPSEIAAALHPHLPGHTHVGLIDMLNEEAAIAPQAEAVPLAGFLDGLRQQGFRLGVATNDAEEPAKAHLDAAGVRDRFDFVAGFDSGFGAKPGPGQLLAFADHVDTRPERVAMVGDSTHDLLAGRAAGMVTVGVLTGLAAESELAPHADVVLPSIGHIPGWLSR
ncbi:HAD family hydrolase [Primorskyibacter sp. S87]|uniref:HAD family hydrolase n=1 Tax=Primorskyibacter sp. S87 TaxID=3415126 RepID=UPI003C7D50E1